MASERKRDTIRVELSDIDVHAEAVPSPLGYVPDLKTLIHENERYSAIIIF